jgi:hypothetical protein
MLRINRFEKIVAILILVCVIGLAQLGEVRGTVGGDPSFKSVEFNEERKWPGQTHIVQHGIMLKVVAELKESHKQSMKADLIFIDEDDNTRVLRMTKTRTSGENEWHEYELDTNTFNPGPYRVRIKAWNMPLETTGDQEGITSKEVVWGDLYLSLQTQQVQPPPLIPGFPWEAIGIGVLLATAALIIKRKHQQVAELPF